MPRKLFKKKQVQLRSLGGQKLFLAGHLKYERMRAPKPSFYDTRITSEGRGSYVLFERRKKTVKVARERRKRR